jgi:hypothetical protein
MRLKYIKQLTKGKFYTETVTNTFMGDFKKHCIVL